MKEYKLIKEFFGGPKLGAIWKDDGMNEEHSEERAKAVE
jgi:hypothetical protein